MSINIDKVPERWQPFLRKADAEEGANGFNGEIDTASELKRAIFYLPANLVPLFLESIKVDIEKYPGNKTVLRKADSYDGKKGYNGQIDNAVEFLEVLNNLPPTESDQFVAALNYNADFGPKVGIKAVRLSPAALKGRVPEALKDLAQFFLRNASDQPPAAVKKGRVNGRPYLAAYHIYEDLPTHLRNGGATTSEGQVLFFNFMVLYGISSGNEKMAQAAYNYIICYMMPHDGVCETPQLPDSKFKGQQYTPQHLHWLVDVSGEAKTGDRVIAPDTTYKVYGDNSPREVTPSIALNPRTKLPDFSRTWGPGDQNTYRFAAANDADFWLIEGFYFASKYLDLDFRPDIRRMIPTLQRDLVGLKDGTAGVRFGTYWGGNVSKKMDWTASTKDIYTGYQAPGAFVVMGQPKTAAQITRLLINAQKEYKRRYGLDLFMPVVHPNGKMDWQGADPNTHWMGFQYRAFAHLAFYYYLTGDKAAKAALDKFVRTIQKHGWKENGSKIALAFAVNKGTDGKISLITFAPNEHGLMAQGLIYLAKKSGDKKYRVLAEKLLNDLAQNRQTQTGKQKGSFYFTDPMGSQDGIYGFHNSEVGIAFGLYSLLLNR